MDVFIGRLDLLPRPIASGEAVSTFEDAALEFRRVAEEFDEFRSDVNRAVCKWGAPIRRSFLGALISPWNISAGYVMHISVPAVKCDARNTRFLTQVLFILNNLGDNGPAR